MKKAFFICFEMSATINSVSVLLASVRFAIREITARLFMHKIREEMKLIIKNLLMAQFKWMNL